MPSVLLAVQDNQLQQLPDICCHQRLTCLLLDSNKLSSITPAAISRPDNSSSSGGSAMRQPHSVLQTLSLTINQLTSICSGVGGPSSSSSSDWRLAGWSAQGLSLWLPGLQTLQLSGNQLSDLHGLQGCSNLRVLDVSRNHLTDVQVSACCVARPRELACVLHAGPPPTARSMGWCLFAACLMPLHHGCDVLYPVWLHATFCRA